MDMKRILQALDSASTKKVEGASDMSKFVRIVKEAEQVPAMPDITGLQPGQPKDLGDGAKVVVNKDGTVSYSGAWGTYVYNAQGQHIKTVSPAFAGVQNTTNVDGSSSTSYQQGPLSIQQNKDAGGNVTATDTQYQLGAEKIRQQKVGNKTANSVAETYSFKDYLQMIEEGLKDPKDNPCWKGYKPVGTKKKGGRTVPNCVPKE